MHITVGNKKGHVRGKAVRENISHLNNIRHYVIRH